MKYKLFKSMIFILFIFIPLHAVGKIVPLLINEETNANKSKIYNTTSFKCVFNNGVIWDPNRNKMHNLNEKIILMIDSINLKNNSARMIGNQSSTDVTVLSTPLGINFFEITDGGNINYTTIFRTKTPKHINSELIYPIVQSRHLNFYPLAKPLSSQWYGYCMSWD